MDSLADAAHLRYHEHSCFNCRYYRVHETKAVCSECLALGRTLGITTKKNAFMLAGWAKQAVCDVWACRPKNWIIYSKGVDNSPYWKDPYLPRDLNERRKKTILSKCAVGNKERLGWPALVRPWFSYSPR